MKTGETAGGLPAAKPDGVVESAATSRLNALLRSDPAGFYRVCIERLQAEREASGGLAATLADAGMLLRALCDPALGKERAAELARAAAGEGVDLRSLATTYVAECFMSGRKPEEIQRTVEVLSDVVGSETIAAAVGALARQSDPHLQSRAVLLAGRVTRSARWLQEQLHEPDARVRANAVEAAWGLDTKDARALLNAAARHRDNRVCGNALLGLYRLGETPAIADILRLAERDSTRFQATAAWVMGETGDPRFLRALARLMGHTDAMVRKRAAEAICRIGTARTRSRQGGIFEMAGSAAVTAASRSLWLTVKLKDATESARLLGTHFLLAEGGAEVLDYTVEQHPPGPRAIALLFPAAEGAAVESALAQALEGKPAQEHWAAIAFDSSEPAASNAEIANMEYLAETAQIRRAVVEVGSHPLCGGLAKAVAHVLGAGAAPELARRQVVIYACARIARFDSAALSEAARRCEARIDVLSAAENPALQPLARNTSGTFRRTVPGEQLAASMNALAFEVRAPYVIRYQAVSSDADSVLVRVQSPEGSGETTIPFGGPAP